MHVLDRIWYWWNVLAEARRRAPSRDDLERAEREREQQRLAAWQDAVAEALVLNGGSWFPTDEAGAPRAAESWVGPTGAVWTRLP